MLQGRRACAAHRDRDRSPPGGPRSLDEGFAGLKQFQQKCEAVLRPELRENQHLDCLSISKKGTNNPGIDGGLSIWPRSSF
ncbi:hypothetical protein EXZ48_21035 [Shinella sp. JR1-6]|nr:hypothetical protein EXZ48_21035 [Shinella sp. JR1-6]